MLFASLNPVVTALIEDFTFRHTLLLKFPVWNRCALARLLTLGNALVLGGPLTLLIAVALGADMSGQ